MSSNNPSTISASPRLWKGKRVLLASGTPISTMGGANKVLLDQAKYLQEQGANVELLVMRYEPEHTFPDFAAFPIHNLRIRGNFILRELIALFRFGLKKLPQYDLVIIHHFPAVLLALRNTHCPLAYFCHSPHRLLYDQKKDYLSRIPFFLRPLARCYLSILTMLDQLAVRRIPSIIATSKNIQRRIQQYYHRKAPIVYSFVEITPAKKVITFSKDILSVARLYPNKRVDVLVQAMAHLPDYRLVIVGSGPEYGRLVQLAQVNKFRNVTFLGEVSFAKLQQLYAQCFCVAYIPQNEDFGLVPLEAHAYGKMVIGIKEGGLLETVRHGGDGILVDHAHPEAIAAAVRRLERMNLHERSKACFAGAQRFSKKQWTAAFDKCFSRGK